MRAKSKPLKPKVLKLKAPSETFESTSFARWLSHQSALLYSKIPIGDSTLSGEEGGKLRAMGVRRGVPDFVIVHKYTRRVFFVEMKKRIGWSLSDEQKNWLKALGEQGYMAFGRRDAIEAVKHYFRQDGLRL